MWIVKDNHPRLHTQLRGLPWAQIPAVDEQKDRGHDRAETRRVKLTAVGAGIGFPHARPHARLAIRIQRRRRRLDSRTWTSETVYAITSMNWRQAGADLVADAVRGHWWIEALALDPRRVLR